MSDFAKIGYYDLKLEAREHKLPKTAGFESEILRLMRILSRTMQNNAIISAPSGCGKSALLSAWAESAYKSPLFVAKKIALLNAATIQKIGQLPQNSLTGYQEAFASLENCVLIIDSFGEMVYQNPGALQNWNTLVKPLFFKQGVSVILSMQPDELLWLTENKSHFLSHFEVLKLEPLNDAAQLEILKIAETKLGVAFEIEDGVLGLIIRLSHSASLRWASCPKARCSCWTNPLPN